MPRAAAVMALLRGSGQRSSAGSTYRPPQWAGLRGGTRRLRGRSKGLRSAGRSHFHPHQSTGERTRRLWQVHEGQLAGGVARKRPGGEREVVPFVSDEARHTAHGILHGGHRG